MSDTAAIPKRRPIPVRLSEPERAKLERLAAAWGVSLAGALRRLLLEKEPER